MLKFSSLLPALGVASGLIAAVAACAAVPDAQVAASAASAASSSSGTASSAVAASAAPDPGKPILERVCQSCHDIGVLSQTPHTADEWPAIVQRMRSNGADLNSADAKLVVQYLQKAYVPKP